MIKRFISIIIILAITVWLGQPEIARADGSLFLSPPSASYTVGSTFTVTLVVGTNGQAINAGQGTISFSTDILEANGVSSSGSIFSLWPVQPSISGGQISFAGGLPTPGYTGNGGRIISATFKAKAVGTATVRITSGQLLLDDGLGTNILTGFGSATYTITEVPAEEPGEPAPPVVVEEEEEEEEEEEVSVLAAPKITSDTHSDQKTWYSNNNPQFEWDKLERATDFSYVFDDMKTTPDDDSEGEDNTIQYSDTGDGIWYFHLKVKNEAGWSETSHFKVQIDITSPLDFDVRLGSETITTNQTPNIFFETTDATSGLDRYEILVDGKLVATLSPDDKTTPYKLDTLDFGEHTVTVRAYDKAGNMTEASSVSFRVLEHYPGIGFWLGSIYILYLWVIFGLIILALALVVWLLIILLRRRKNDEDDEKPAKGTTSAKAAGGGQGSASPRPVSTPSARYQGELGTKAGEKGKGKGNGKRTKKNMEDNKDEKEDEENKTSIFQ